MKFEKFKKEIWDFYYKYRRKFPWRNTTNPYRILVSEVMLQQTQAGRAIGKYNAFIKKFPNFKALSEASLQEVLAEWRGLGYNRRAVALKRIAEIVIREHKGILPKSIPALDELPGIGEATASSIAAFAWNQPVVFIETNIRRVYIHFFFADKEKVRDEDLFPLIGKTADPKNAREWYYALMDYGAMLKGKVPNPNRKSAHYLRQSKFKGSNREVRGAILGHLTKHKGVITKKALYALDFEKIRIEDALSGLIKEGFLEQAGQKIRIKEN